MKYKYTVFILCGIFFSSAIYASEKDLKKLVVECHSDGYMEVATSPRLVANIKNKNELQESDFLKFDVPNKVVSFSVKGKKYQERIVLIGSTMLVTEGAYNGSSYNSSYAFSKDHESVLTTSDYSYAELYSCKDTGYYRKRMESQNKKSKE